MSLDTFEKNPEFVGPVPDQVRDGRSDIQMVLTLLEPGFRRNDVLQ